MRLSTTNTPCVLGVLAVTAVYVPGVARDVLLVFNAVSTFSRIYEPLEVLSVTVCVEPVWHFLYKSGAGLLKEMSSHSEPLVPVA